MTSMTVIRTIDRQGDGPMYVKLFSSIVHSSIWSEDSDTCKVWITLMALADREGFFFGSIDGLARVTALPVEVVASAIKKFLAPDTHSSDRKREPERDGRRIEEIDGGWKLLNGPWYRDLKDADERRAQNRDAKRKQRAIESALVSIGHRRSASVVPRHPSEPETESDAESKKKGGGVRFAPPTLEEVHEYAKELPGLRVEAFFDFYASKGWKVGNSPMKDWRAAARRWRRKDTEDGKITPPKAAKELTQEQRRYDEVMKDFAGDLKAWEAIHGPSKLLR